MIEERAHEEEQAKLERMMIEKERERCLSKGSGPDEEFDFGKYRRKFFVECTCRITVATNGQRAKSRWPEG